MGSEYLFCWPAEQIRTLTPFFVFVISSELGKLSPKFQSGGARLNGQIEVKSGALPVLAYDAYFARVEFEYSLGDGKSQPH